jgi:outer membrane protein TolC
MSTLLRGASALALAAGLTACAIDPEPFTAADLKALVAADQAKLFGKQQAIDKPISLAEAMARAVKYNLDHRMRLLETAIAHGDADARRWELLPKVVANAGYSYRNSDNASRSKSVLTGDESLAYSTSSERDVASADLTMAWNVLDFGITYFRAKQMADNVLISEEERRRAVQQIFQDVRYAYWRAVSAQRLLPRVEALHKQVTEALAASREAEKRRLEAPEKALEYQQTLLETMRDIGAIKRDLVLARTELSTLMNLPPGTDFTLAEPEGRTVPQVSGALSRLQQLALFNRPEVRGLHYQQRVTANDVNIALLRMLPGFDMSQSWNWSENSYLFHQGWTEKGLKLTWNLMSVVSGPEFIRQAEAREQHTELKRLGVSMAVLTQVNIAYLRQAQVREDYDLAEQLHKVVSRLDSVGAAASAANAESGLRAISRTSKMVFAELRRDNAYAELQAAVGRLYASVGADPLPRQMMSDDLPAVTAEIDKSLAAWDKGSIGPSLQVEPNPDLPGTELPPTAPERWWRSLFGSSEAPATNPATAATAPAPAPAPVAAPAAPAKAPARPEPVQVGMVVEGPRLPGFLLTK